MKNNTPVIFITIVFIFLFANYKNIFAQENTREFITVNIDIKKENFSHKIKIPITSNLFETNGLKLKEGEFYAGGFVTVDCFKCDLISEYNILGTAVRANNKASEVTLSVEFRNKDKCSIKNKRFSLERGKSKNFRLKCDVKISANYEN